MTEDFLHYLWKYGLFDKENVSTTAGQKVIILNFGWHNFDSGPDFFNGKVKINETIWVGNIEIHQNSSDWRKHKHSDDKSYENIILHVVYNSDDVVKRSNGEIIPEISLKGRFDENLYLKYRNFIDNELWVPCEKMVKAADKFILETWLNRVFFEKMENKSNDLIEILEKNKFDWNFTFYILLARNFGFKLNSDAFECLAISIPLKYLLKHRDNLFQIEALLYGQAGFLEEDFLDEFPNMLQNEYQFLKHKYSLIGIEKVQWKFMRLRPANFPTIRISQFAHLICKSSNLFSKIIEMKNVVEIKRLLEVSASVYWNNHYLFDKDLGISKEKILGKESLNLILINTIIPLIFVYGIVNNLQYIKNSAVQFLLDIKPERNSIIAKWENAGVVVENAFQSQALIMLKKNYCESKKCLSCGIGNDLLKR